MIGQTQMSPRSRIFLSVSLLGFILVLGVISGSFGANAATTSVSARPLKVAWSLYPGYSPFVIAFEKDWITKHGGSVKPVLYDVSAKQLPDFEAEKIDGGFFALADALTLAARSPGKFRLVMVADNSDGADLVVAAPEIAHVTDLRGQRIGTGIGSFRELLVRQMLQAHGLSVNDVVLVNMGPEEVPDAIPDTIKAGQTWHPFAAQAIANDGHVIFSSSETPGLIPDVLVFRTSVIAQRPDDVRAVVDAWFEALEFWRSHPSEGNAHHRPRHRQISTGCVDGGHQVFQPRCKSPCVRGAWGSDISLQECGSQRRVLDRHRRAQQRAKCARVSRRLVSTVTPVA